MWPVLQATANLVTFTEETHDGKLYFLCNDKTDALFKHHY